MKRKALSQFPNLDEEDKLKAQGYELIAGIDEVGRGALAGPVVAGAVILPNTANLPWFELVRDSKELNSGKRESLFESINKEAIAVGIGIVPPKVIDTVNILKATIYPRKEGLMVLELSGHRKNFQKGVRYLKSLGVKLESIGQDIRRDDEVCFQCGACTAVCPTGALSIQRPEMAVIFDKDKCSACELCVMVCPARAMIVKFDKSLLS